MERQIHRLLRLLMVQIHRYQEWPWRAGQTEGGLLVALSAKSEKSSCEQFTTNCTVAAAGQWCSGVTMEEVQLEAVQTLSPMASIPTLADPEELQAFAGAYGPLHFQITFQVSEQRQVAQMSWRRMEQFLHRLSMVHAQVEIYFSLKVNEAVSQQIFRVTADSRLPVSGQRVLTDSALYMQRPLSVGPGPQCSRLHHVLGRAVSLLLPPDVAETGMCGETSLLPIAALSPCVLQYPNRPAILADVRLLLYSPSRVPLLCDEAETPLSFLRGLTDLLSWEEFGLSGVQCSEKPTEEGSLCSEVVYTMRREQIQAPGMEQTLTLFLFIQHIDPFNSQLTDFIASEQVLVQNLDQILQHNKEAVKSSLQSLLRSTLSVSLKRLKAQEKLRAAMPVILSSVCSVVSSSSSLDFRTACLDRMKVKDTRELMVSLQQALLRVTERRFLSSNSCHNRKAREQSQAETREKEPSERTYGTLPHRNQGVSHGAPKSDRQENMARHARHTASSLQAETSREPQTSPGSPTALPGSLYSPRPRSALYWQGEPVDHGR